MSSLTGIRLNVGMVLGGGVYFAGAVVFLPDGEAGDLVRQGKAELVSDVHVSAGPSTAAKSIASAQDGDDDE